MEPITVLNLFVWAGNVDGHFDIGIYSPDGTRLVSTGSTARVGSNACQAVAVNAALKPGPLYLAIVVDSATATYRRVVWTAGAHLRSFGLAKQTAVYPLPDLAVLESIATTNYIPIFGLSTRSVI
jgi:hypothetical protein